MVLDRSGWGSEDPVYPVVEDAPDDMVVRFTGINDVEDAVTIKDPYTKPAQETIIEGF